MLVTAAGGAVVGGVVGATASYAKTGKISGTAVLAGVAIGGAIGLTGGAASAYLATGSALASTGSMMASLGYLAKTLIKNSIYLRSAIVKW